MEKIEKSGAIMLAIAIYLAITREQVSTSHSIDRSRQPCTPQYRATGSANIADHPAR
jgi:hypothetical protein